MAAVTQLSHAGPVRVFDCHRPVIRGFMLRRRRCRLGLGGPGVEPADPPPDENAE